MKKHEIIVENYHNGKKYYQSIGVENLETLNFWRDYLEMRADRAIAHNAKLENASVYVKPKETATRCYIKVTFLHNIQQARALAKELEACIG